RLPLFPSTTLFRSVEVSGRSVEPGEDLCLVAEQAAQLQGFGDRGHTEFAPPGREEGGSDEVDAMAVGNGLDDASEAGGGESGGQDRKSTRLNSSHVS